jgi:hypothetical protein
MPELRIDFQDGFDDDTVVVSLGTRELARLEHLTTNLVISRADAVSVELEEGVSHLRIDVPTKGASTELDVNARTTPYVGVQILEGHLEAHPTAEEPFYL